MPAFVLDSSVIIAVIAREPGYETALPVLEKSLVSTVNLAEVAARFARHGLPQHAVEKLLASVRCEARDYTKELSLLTGMLTQQTQPFGLSLGDRACLALAIAKQLPVLTADRIWQKLELPIDIKLLR